MGRFAVKLVILPRSKVFLECLRKIFGFTNLFLQKKVLSRRRHSARSAGLERGARDWSAERSTSHSLCSWYTCGFCQFLCTGDILSLAKLTKTLKSSGYARTLALKGLRTGKARSLCVFVIFAQRKSQNPRLCKFLVCEGKQEFSPNV